LLSDKHKSHSFVSLDEIYEVKKELIVKLHSNLEDLSNKCQSMLEESRINLIKSENNMKSAKDNFNVRVKAWIEDFTSRFNGHITTQSVSKENIESILNQTKLQKVRINDLLENPQKNKLVKSFNENVQISDHILGKQGNLSISEVIDGEEIENHFIPKFSVHECILPDINDKTEVGTYFYAEEFQVVRDKFKLGAKIIQNKKSKSVNITLRISKANNRDKQYEIVLQHPKTDKVLGEFILAVEKNKHAENHILHTDVMNSK
jgi:hypothetical protein